MELIVKEMSEIQRIRDEKARVVEIMALRDREEAMMETI